MSCFSVLSLSAPKEMRLSVARTATEDLARKRRAETPVPTSW